MERVAPSTSPAGPQEVPRTLAGHTVIFGLTAGELSGVDVFCGAMVRGLNALGIPARILLSRPRRAWNPMPLPDDLPRHELSVSRDEPWGSRWRKMIRYLEGQGPCIYVPNYDYAHSCVSPRLHARVRIVGIVHSDDPVHYEHVARLGRFWDAIVAVSPAVAEHTLSLDRSFADRLVTIPYGVAQPARAPRRPFDAGAPLRVVYAGRLEQLQKRVLDLPPVFERLIDRGVPAELTVVGDGHSRDALIRRSETLVSRGAVRFLGTLPNSGVLEVFEQSDVVILTSEFEGLPVCLLEAMSRGCVPVVSDIRGGIPELVEDGVNGFRVPLGDGDAFADRLTILQGDPALRRTMSARAFRTVRERGYDASRMVERYVALFERVVERSSRGEFRRPRGRFLYPPQLENASWKDQLPLPARAAGTAVMRVIRPLTRLLRGRDGGAPSTRLRRPNPDEERDPVTGP